MTKAQAIIAIAEAVLDVIKTSGPLGAPGGHIYAALMPFGVRLEQYEALMSALVASGKVRKSGQCYFPL